MSSYNPPLRYCTRPGCRNPVRGRGCCEQCQSQAGPAEPHEARRPSAAKRGYGRKWQQASKRHLQREPLCRACMQRGEVTAAVAVDHIVAHKGNYVLFWNRDNWQSLCETCHNRKTGLECTRKRA